MSVVIVYTIRETPDGISVKNQTFISGQSENEGECASIVSATVDAVLRGIYNTKKEDGEGGQP